MALFCGITLTAVAIPMVFMADRGMSEIMLTRAERDLEELLVSEIGAVEDRLEVRRQVLSDIAEGPEIVQGAIQAGDALLNAKDRLRGTKLLGNTAYYAMYDFGGSPLHPLSEDLEPFKDDLDRMAAGLIMQPAKTTPFALATGDDDNRRILVGVPIHFQGLVEGALLTTFEYGDIFGENLDYIRDKGDPPPEGWYHLAMQSLPIYLTTKPDFSVEDDQRGRFIGGLMLIGGISITVISCLGWLLAHWTIIKPMRSIEGYSGYVTDKSRSELPPPPSAMARELIHMGQNLHDVGEEILQHRKDLESQVSQRTLELAMQTEIAVKMADEAEQANQAKTDFLANMSHELRTPLNGLLGMTELLMMSKLSDRQNEYLRTMNESGKALLTIINDILDFSKISAGKMTMSPQPTNVATLVYDVASLLYAQANRKGIELLVDYAADAPQGYMVDSGRLRQVLTNIIGNAIKFTDQGQVEISVRKDGPTGIRLAIADSGMGMDKIEQTKIFESFVQVDRSASRRQSGTGLGLAISKRIIEMMGSLLIVDSTLGKGSTFFFSLDLPLAEVPPATDPSLRDLVPADAQVVIADSHPQRSQVIKGICEEFGMAVQQTTHYEGLQQEILVSKPGFIVMHFDLFDHLEDLELYARRIRKELLFQGRLILVAGRTSLDFILPDEVDCLLSGLLQPDSFLRSAVAKSGTRSFRRAGGQAAARNQTPTRLPSPSRQAHPGLEALNPKPVQDDSLAAGGTNVLVVDDNAINRTLMKHHLKHCQLSFKEASNGLEALEAMKGESFDVVLMDCAMPEMDGYQATQAIREWEEQKGEPRRMIVAVTAHALDGERERCLEAGMDDYLTKPVKAEGLYPLLERYCGRTLPEAKT